MVVRKAAQCVRQPAVPLEEAEPGACRPVSRQCRTRGAHYPRPVHFVKPICGMATRLSGTKCAPRLPPMPANPKRQYLARRRSLGAVLPRHAPHRCDPAVGVARTDQDGWRCAHTPWSRMDNSLSLFGDKHSALKFIGDLWQWRANPICATMERRDPRCRMR